MRPATIAAMPNAHSHAFQRDLRGLGERNPDDFWSWRTQMMHLAQALDPESMQRVAAQVYGEMLAAGYGAVGEFHYVHHGPDGTPYDEPNALALAVAQGGARRRPRDRPHPRRLPPRRTAALPRPRRRALPGARRRAARLGGRARGRVGGRRRAHRARRAPRLARGDRRLRLRPRPAPPRPRLRAAPRGPRVPRPARREPDRAAGADRLPRAAHERRARHPRRRARHRAAGRRRRRSSSPARRPRATSATATCRRSPTATPACGWRSAPTRRSASTPSRRRASSRPARAARARRAARCWPTTATCGPSWPATGWRASACEARGTIDVDLDHPDLRGVANDELALALATCASAGAVCRQASRVRAGGGSGL